MKKLVLALLVSALAVTALFGCTPKTFVFDNTQSIVVVSREANSGTRGAFLELIGAKDKGIKAGANLTTSTAALKALVSAMEYSIGYVSTGSVDSTVNVLKVEGVEATSANILSGTYKLQRPFVVIYKPVTENSVEADFLKFLHSKQVQDIAKEEKLVENTAAEFGATYVKPVTNFPTTELKLHGSTSMESIMNAIGEAYMALHPNVKVVVGGSGSGDAYPAVYTNGTAQFGLLSRELKSAEKVGIESMNVAIDGISIIVNKKNTSITNITLAQLKAIFVLESDLGTIEPITKWSELVA